MKQVSTCWTEPLDLVASLRILETVASRFACLGGPIGREIDGLIRSKDYRSLCDFELDYTLDWNVSQLANCRQALGFFTKLEDLEIGVDKERAGFEKFEDAERSCQESNSLFRALSSGLADVRPDDNVILCDARRFIARVLGRCPSIAELELRFGPGATTSIKRSDASPVEKLAETPTCSSSLVASGLLPEVVRSCEEWFSCHATHWAIDDDDYLYSVNAFRVDCGRLEFVPKSAKTYRCIDKQPTVNSLVQAGIGRFISGRLRRAGLDLRSTEPNHRFAFEGSLNGLTATIDLSNASDTISKGLVEFLLPEDWYLLLCAARCPQTLYKGQRISLHKFSSMGNGFTFPLESLVFWALTVCSTPRALRSMCTVFGDDIICPTECYGRVVKTLELCGFEVNLSKSYSSGSFRESCGRDYYKGTNVRPYYQKHLVSGQTLFTLHNYFVRSFQDEMAAWVKNLIPTPLRLYGPDGYGDGHLVSSKWPAKRQKEILSNGWGGSFFETFSLEPRRIASRFPGDYVTPLYSVYVRGREDLGPKIGFYEFSDEGLGVDFTKSGRPLWTYPSDESTAYRKTLVYTFSS